MYPGLFNFTKHIHTNLLWHIHIHNIYMIPVMPTHSHSQSAILVIYLWISDEGLFIPEPTLDNLLVGDAAEGIME